MRRIYLLPSQYPTPEPSPQGDVAIPNFGGRFDQLLGVLIQQGFITLKSEEDYGELIKLYQQEADFKADELKNFQRLVGTIEQNPNANQGRIVRLLAVRGNKEEVDYSTLLLIRQLTLLNIPLEILYANPDGALLSGHQPPLNSQNKPSISSSQSKDNGHPLIQNSQLLTPDHIIELITAYRSCLKLFSHSILANSVTIFAHAPVGLSRVQEVAQELKVNYDASTQARLTQTIENIHTAFTESFNHEDTDHGKLPLQQDKQRLFSVPSANDYITAFIKAILSSKDQYATAYHELLQLEKYFPTDAALTALDARISQILPLVKDTLSQTKTHTAPATALQRAFSDFMNQQQKGTDVVPYAVTIVHSRLGTELDCIAPWFEDQKNKMPEREDSLPIYVTPPTQSPTSDSAKLATAAAIMHEAFQLKNQNRISQHQYTMICEQTTALANSPSPSPQQINKYTDLTNTIAIQPTPNQKLVGLMLKYASLIAITTVLIALVFITIASNTFLPNLMLFFAESGISIPSLLTGLTVFTLVSGTALTTGIFCLTPTPSRHPALPTQMQGLLFSSRDKKGADPVTDPPPPALAKDNSASFSS